jgi:hypothetical protein
MAFARSAGGIHRARAITRVPCFASSPRMPWVTERTAALDAHSDPIAGTDTRPRIDARFTIAPPPFFARTGANARLNWTGPNTLVSNSSRIAARSGAPITGAYRFTPALLTSTSTSGHLAASAAIWSAWVTSSCTGTTPSGSSAATASAAESWRAAA